MNDQVTLDSGARMEELLREYFLRAGYFVVRGVKLRFAGSDVTDLDLWLYSRRTSLSRERVNVDAKYKQTPKALERVLWAKGAQLVAGTERCIVATTDRRPIVKQFGLEQQVVVLDGHVLSRLAAASRAGERPSNARLAEEDLLALVIGNKRDGSSWRGRLIDAKSRLVDALDFGGCNVWLDDTMTFLRAAEQSSEHRPLAIRLACLCGAYFLIGLDFASKELAFEEGPSRREGIETGLRYGATGRIGMERNLDLTASLIASFAPEQAQLGIRIKRQALSEVEDLKLGALAEFLAKTDVMSDLVFIAIELESEAFLREPRGLAQLGPKAKALVGAFLDMAAIDRALLR